MRYSTRTLKHRVRYYLATAYEEKGDFDFAEKEFRNIPDKDNSFVDSRLHLAYIYERQGRFENTIKELTAAIKAKGENTELLRLLASVYRGARMYNGYRRPAAPQTRPAGP
jgi:Tfp pilus assembly protein PilF